MMELLEANWVIALVALLFGLLLAWYAFHARRRTRVTGARRDVLDEGAAPAERNRALIDAPPAAQQPVAVETPPAPKPAPAPVTPQPASAQAQPQGADDLARIKGVGPKIVQLLNELGVNSFAQIAAWDDAEIDRIDSLMGRFQGRIRRDDWVGQARLLAAGDDAGFADQYGKLG